MTFLLGVSLREITYNPEVLGVLKEEFSYNQFRRYTYLNAQYVLHLKH